MSLSQGARKIGVLGTLSDVTLSQGTRKTEIFAWGFSNFVTSL
jgi:hypothetical protein